MIQPARRAHHQVTFAVLALAVATYALLQSLVTPVLPTIMESLHTNQTTVTWVLTAYLLSASIFTPIMGRIGDAVGKKKMLLVALGALAAGSALAAIATGITLMIIARVIQGVGGGILPLAFGIIRDEFPLPKVSSAIGVLAALTAVGAGLGLVLAGPIVDLLDYHWLFWVPLIMVLLATAAAVVFIPESAIRTPSRISITSALLLSAWLVCLLLGLSEGPDWGWTSGKVLGLLAGAVVIGGAWVVVEARSTAPLIDMTMMRLPAVWTTNLVALLIGVGMYALMAFLPQFVQTPASAGYGFGATITESGLILLPLSITMFAVGIASGPLAARYGSKAVVVTGSAVTIISFALIAFAHHDKWEVYIATAVMGIGLGLAFSAMASLIVEAVPAHQTGVASGMNANIRTIGGSIGAALMATIVTSGAGSDGMPKESGYTNGFAMLAGATVLALIAALAIPAARRGHPATAQDLPHAELGLVPGGALLGADPE
ncbi:Major facilitator superfamily MFS_1 [Parafrankia sp. Ea1.12]|uniref:MFS transporter n=1 Tax=Parafrankia sp. Ea1.12 TaxID=573499 RepID=UPI000DA5C9F4|nr:MFS transporter [Parafrankia sp. Ea1.12]SQD97300.1 Major facilitator superfamily MFS_1 [Parafrankia sp. Ea1.12]